jgi:hypothetical protein
MSPVEIMEHVFPGNNQWQPEIKYSAELPPIVRDWRIYLSDTGGVGITNINFDFPDN